MISYSSIQNRATGLLRQVGGPCSIITSEGTTVRFSGVMTSADENDFPAGSTITGVDSARQVVLIPGNLKVRPSPGDTITTPTGTFTVLQVSVVQPAKVPLLYKALVQR